MLSVKFPTFDCYSTIQIVSALVFDQLFNVSNTFDLYFEAQKV